MKKLTLSLLLSAAATAAFAAVPPLQRTFTQRQADGSLITVTRHGNGNLAYYATTDGYALLRTADGKFRYTLPQADGSMKCSEVVAHNPESRCLLEQKYAKRYALRTEQADDLVRRAAAPIVSHAGSAPAKHGTFDASPTPNGLGKYGQSAGGTVNSIGRPVIPVIMVAFADKAFADSTTVEKVTRLMNEQGYADEPGCVGSVKDYFTAQSAGMFTPTFEVVAKVTLSGNRADYGANYSNGAIDRNRIKFVKESVTLAEAAGADFSKYDINDNGVPLVSIYHAGAGEHTSYEAGSEDLMWAHFSRLNVPATNTTIRSYYIGDEQINSYALDEKQYIIISGTTQSGIGVFCHEFGHALGLPDFYYTGSDPEIKQSAAMMNFWSIMDYGQYFYNGYAPVGYTAYEKSFMGWLDVKTLDAPQFATLYPQGREQDGATAYALVNPANASEYFLLENRQPSVWYPSAMGRGMFVTHVDYLASAWSGNSVNNTKGHKRMQVLQADGTIAPRSGEGIWADYKGDLFPGTMQVRDLTDTTSPAATTTFSGTGLSQPLYNITLTPENLITFAFIDPTLTGINNVAAEGNNVSAAELLGNPEAEFFTIDGRRLNGAPEHHGLYLVKTPQSGVKKIRL